MQLIDDAWVPLALAAEAAGTTEGKIVERLNDGVLRGYQAPGGLIYVHKDELIRLRAERESHNRTLFMTNLMANARYDNPADQAAHEARIFGKSAKRRG